MRIHQEELEHPTQASRVRLAVYELDGPVSEVHGMDAARGGASFLVTEDRIGVSTVVATLGAFATREEAVSVARRRAEDLGRQRYRVVAS